MISNLCALARLCQDQGGHVEYNVEVTTLSNKNCCLESGVLLHSVILHYYTVKTLHKNTNILSLS